MHICQELADRDLRDQPTIPPSASLDNVNAGELWPGAFCAFKGCGWEAMDGTDELLDLHLHEEHAAKLEPIVAQMLRADAPDAMSSVYKEAVACKCRSQPPIAAASLDRRALKSFAAATCQGRVESLICFCCGGTHPYVEEVAEKGDIQWYQPIQPRDDDGPLLFLGRPLQEIEQLIGLPTYLSRYNDLDTEGRKLTDHESFEDWHLKLPNLADGRLLCCPEAQIT